MHIEAEIIVTETVVKFSSHAQKGYYIMKTRIIAFIAALLMLSTSLVGCKKSDTADLHIFYYSLSDTYIASVKSTLVPTLKEKGISYQEYDGNGNQTTQSEQIQTAITKGAKVIAVNIVNTGSDDAASGIVNMAKNAGIPVIFFNREVSDAVISSYEKCVFVGTKAEESGMLQGEMIGEYLKANFDKVDLNGDGEISYILFKGEEGNNEAIYRTKYSVEEANKILSANGMKPLKFYDANNRDGYLVDKGGLWSASAANEYMTTALASYNEKNKNMIELVICNNDGMAEGAVTALAAVGYNAGGGKKIPVFGIDATDAAKNLIKDGKMVGTVKQDAEGMAKALSRICQNATAEGVKLLDNMGEYPIDEKVNKIRIHYSKYLGE